MRQPGTENREQRAGGRRQRAGYCRKKQVFTRAFKFVLITLAVLYLPGLSQARKFPKPTGYVNDFAGVIDDGKQREMETLLHDVETKTTAEVAVVTVPKCAPMDSFTYRTELFKEWGIGKKGKDNGLLLLLCLEERRIEIEVGYGLEGVITDSIAGEILDKYVTPDFKQGNYGAGFLRGAQVIASKILGSDEAAMPPVSPSYTPNGMSTPMTVFVVVLVVGGGLGLLFLISYLLKPACPKCNLKKFVKRTNTVVITHATHYSSGLKDVTYFCKQCNYEWTRRETIPQITESSSSGGFGGGGFGGFGGGSSGGGGAGRSF